MKKVLIIGAGIGGCAAAISFAQQGWKPTVIEKLSTIFTEGAGILLYSNALKTLDHLGILDPILVAGESMQGKTDFLDSRSRLIGSIQYTPVDEKYPAYTGIQRQTFLEILYNKALSLNAEFVFGKTVKEYFQEGKTVSLHCNDGSVFSKYDLLIAADGINSQIRKQMWPDEKSKYSGFHVWHSMHQRHADVKEKITVVLNDRRFGIIPISKKLMYVWASVYNDQKIKIEKKDQPRIMREEFNNVEGFLKEIINGINDQTYVHFTAVEEVSLKENWYKDNVVLLGDAAHASLPFMAQGAAMALHDAFILGNSVSSSSLDIAFKNYQNIRKPVVNTVQQMCRSIGSSYNQEIVDLNRIQKSMDEFYGNKNFF
jgi:2-polyprenyl-6-methoxyphenol hydroxylase-like FAD-dependent oxidoreductase